MPAPIVTIQAPLVLCSLWRKRLSGIRPTTPQLFPILPIYRAVLSSFVSTALTLRRVRQFLETHGDGRFAMWHRAADDHAAKTLHRAGVRRMLNADGEPIKTNGQHGTEYGDRMPAAMGEGVSFEYFVLAETFKAEVCQGFDRDAVCRVLLEHGCLVPDKGRSFDAKPRLPGMGLTRCYRIPPAIFGLDL